MATALVLEKIRELSIRDIDLAETLSPDDVRIKIDTVGIAAVTCTIIPTGGSDRSW